VWAKKMRRRRQDQGLRRGGEHPDARAGKLLGCRGGFVGRGRWSTLLQAAAIESIFTQKVVQGSIAGTNLPATFEEVEHFVAGGVRVLQEVLGDRARVARKQCTGELAG
jgi:hypothetical protein